MTPPLRLMKFPPRPPVEPPLSVNDPRVRAILDRLQVLARRKPTIAVFLLEWNERFLTRWGA